MRFELDEAISILERTLATLRQLLDGLSEPWILGTEGPDTWSPFDVLGHLIHGERTDWMGRAQIILAQGESLEFEPFDRFAQFEASKGLSLAELLDEFAQLRAANLETLKKLDLSQKSFDLPGLHPALGRVNLRQLLATWAVHDLGHITQIARVMAKQYAGEVGPWGEYLTVLHDSSSK